MRCEVCEAEVANSEELKAHMEREHPLGQDGDEELESPDMLDAQKKGATIVPGKN
jgi:hypothetical protein